MKKIIIYTTNDDIVSLHLVNKIVSDKSFKEFEFHILLSNPGLLRKIKIPVKASEDEINANIRARSARLRVAEII